MFVKATESESWPEILKYSSWVDKKQIKELTVPDFLEFTLCGYVEPPKSTCYENGCLKVWHPLHNLGGAPLS